MRCVTMLGPASLFIVLVSNLANAQESAWQRTFVPVAVGSYLPGGKNDIIVVTADDASHASRGDVAHASRDATTEDRVSARRALETALRLSGCVGLVMNAAGLGNLAGLDDAQIVKRAAGMPINRVAILRLFPSRPGEPLRAVVTFYDKAGVVVGAFSAIADSPLDRAETRGSAAAEGTSAKPTNEVAEHVTNHKEDHQKALSTYDQFFIGFDDWAAITRSGHVVRTWTEPWQGKYRKPLRGAAFYDALGRKDLAAKYESKQNTKVGITVLGGVAVALGGIVFFSGVGHAPDYSSSNSEDWESDADSTRMIVGLLITAAGTAMATVPWFVSSHPVDAPEARRLADQHNQELKAKLGLALGDETPPQRSSARAISALSAAPVPFALPQGGGLALVGRY